MSFKARMEETVWEIGYRC